MAYPELRLHNATYISKEIHTEIYSRCNPEHGDLLYIKDGATTGIVTINNLIEPFSMLSSVALLKVSQNIENKFLLILLRSPFFYEEMRAEMTGVAITRVTLKKLNDALIPLPPLKEQQRIVAKVDSLMVLCDKLEMLQQQRQQLDPMTQTAVLDALLPSPLAGEGLGMGGASAWQRLNQHMTTLFHTPESVKALRETILQLAVMGKLVPQDPNDEPAAVLLQHIAAEKDRLIQEGKIKRQKPLPAIRDDEKPFELPNGWEWARFREIGEFGRGKSKHRPRNDPKLFTPSIYPLIQTGEVARAINTINEYHSRYSEFGLLQSKLWPKGTLCITIAANIADSAILGFDACFPDSVVGYVPYKPLNDAKYIFFFMKTARANLLKFAPSTAQKNINLEILESVLIPFPPLAEQQRIVAKVDSLMALCDKLETRLQAARETARLFAAEAVATM